MQYNISEQSVRSRFFHGARQKMRVIIALTAREMVTAYGNRKLGYVWALVEPAAFVLIFVIVHSFAREHVPFGESAVLFLITGMLSFRVFMSIAGRTLNAITANQALLTYPQVRPLDTIFARLIIQSLTMLVVLVGFYATLHFWQGIRVIVDPIAFTISILVTIYLAGSIGLFNAVIAAIFPSWESVWSMMSLPLLIFSGVFFVPALLPPFAQDALYWNPLFHCVDLVRASSYLNYLTFANYEYPIAFATICLVFSLSVERLYRNLLLTSR